MKLDLNFDELTKLKDWWIKVKNNFSIIETECTLTRNIAENACTKEQAQAYVAEFAGAVPEYAEAIGEFTQMYENNEDVLAVLNTITNNRYKYYEITDEGFSADTPEEDAVYMCKTAASGTPQEEEGMLINFSGNNGFQIWISGGGEGIYHRASGGEWEKGDTELREAVAELNERVNEIEAGKSEVVFGVYTGDGEAQKDIELGFYPAGVEVYAKNGNQGFEYGVPSCTYGGLALKGYGCERGKTAIEVTENGFRVFKYTDNDTIRTNIQNTVYYFKAYKTGQIMEV